MMTTANEASWQRLGSVEEAIRKVVGDHYGLPAMALSASTELRRDLGADDIDAREVMMTVEELFGLYFDLEAKSLPSSIGEIVRLVEQNLALENARGPSQSGPQPDGIGTEQRRTREG